MKKLSLNKHPSIFTNRSREHLVVEDETLAIHVL